jgi:hypothetical protein
MECKNRTEVSEATISLRWEMNGEARCSVSGPTKYALRHGFRQKYISTEEAVREWKKQSVEEQLAFKKRGHRQTAPTQDIRGSESTVRNDCNTD